MNKYLHTICILTSIVSLLFICVDEELIPGFISCLDCVDPKGMNGVMSVIGGSFIAGYIFYLLTVTIPFYSNKSASKNNIKRHVEVINANIVMYEKAIKLISKTLVFMRMAELLDDGKSIKLLCDQNTIIKKDTNPVEFNTMINCLKLINSTIEPNIRTAIYALDKYTQYLDINQQNLLDDVSGHHFLDSSELIDDDEVKLAIFAAFVPLYYDLKSKTESLLESLD